MIFVVERHYEKIQKWAVVKSGSRAWLAKLGCTR